ncbi:hypothetical protein ACO0LV_17790 [Pseudactinotalea sp. Z1739]|uniref:hypothetical protein n=1 Tax=Pseudactinotalea sp. Z1739 TaxID=3413028 RepID=UPI003C79DA75
MDAEETRVAKRAPKGPKSHAGGDEQPAQTGVTRRALLLGGVGAVAVAGLVTPDTATAAPSAGGGLRNASANTGATSALDFTTREAFEAVYDHLDGGPPLDTDNLAGVLGWQVQYILLAYLQMYIAHRDVAYLDRFIERADAALNQRDHIQGVEDYRGLSLPGWSRDQYAQFPGSMHLPVETGNIVRPIAWFARIVASTPQLRQTSRFGDRVQPYTQAAIDAVAIHDEHWDDHEDGTGIYFFPKGSPHEVDGIQCAFNMNHTMGMAMMHLHALTGDGAYLDKVQKMVRLFESDRSPGAGDGYFWNYQWTGSWGFNGWTPADNVSVNRASYPGNPAPEDFSHGALSMEFIAQVWHERLGSQVRDLQSYAKTFDRTVVETDYGLDITRFIDGTGGIRDGRDATHAGTWAVLARHNPNIVSAAQDIYAHYAFEFGASRTATMLAAISELNRFAAGGLAGPQGPFPPED